MIGMLKRIVPLQFDLRNLDRHSLKTSERQNCWKLKKPPEEQMT